MKKQPLKKSILTYLKSCDERGMSVAGLHKIINGRRTSHPVSINTLYSYLAELLNDGLVESFHREDSRVKKYYKVVPKVVQ